MPRTIVYKLFIAGGILLAGICFLSKDIVYKSCDIDHIKKQISVLENEYNLTIEHTLGNEAIPDAFKTPPSNATAVSLKDQELCYCVPILYRELKKYPVEVINKDIKTIFLLDRLQFSGVPYGGTVIGRAVYLTWGGHQHGYDDTYFSSLIHHEFSSVFFQKYPFPIDEWIAANPTGFEYAHTNEQIIEAIKKGELKDKKHYLDGFLSEYGRSTLENDFNAYAELLFSQPERIRELSSKYPRVKRKIELTKQYYLNISNTFIFKD